MNIGDVVQHEGVYYKIVDRIKAPCEHCEWFYLLDGLNYYICESKLGIEDERF